MSSRMAAALISLVVAGVLALLWAGCGHARDRSSQTETPVSIDMVRGVRWDYPHEGYDPTLPGFRVAGGIGTVTLSAATVPEEFVLELRTTMAHQPNLEGFSVGWADTLMQITPFVEGAAAELIHRPEGGTGRGERTGVEQIYFEFVRTAETVRVRFLPPALRLLGRGCTVSWVDWYRR